MVINLPTPVKYNCPLQTYILTGPLVARIGTEQNGAKEAPILNREKSQPTYNCQLH